MPSSSTRLCAAVGLGGELPSCTSPCPLPAEPPTALPAQGRGSISDGEAAATFRKCAWKEDVNFTQAPRPLLFLTRSA